MEWVIGIIIFILIGGLIELFDKKGFRSKLSAVFGWITLIATLIVIGCVVFLSYVGVWVIYIGVPTILISGFLWWLLLPKTKNEQANK